MECLQTVHQSCRIEDKSSYERIPVCSACQTLASASTMPCKLHGMDHLPQDPNCEFCKRALGPYRHLKEKYGTQIVDYKPTLSFDLCGPPHKTVTGAKILMVFVWRLLEVRLLCLLPLIVARKENVLSCLQSVTADLNTLTGGSKPPVTENILIKPKEFLFRSVTDRSWNG